MAMWPAIRDLDPTMAPSIPGSPPRVLGVRLAEVGRESGGESVSSAPLKKVAVPYPPGGRRRHRKVSTQKGI